MTGKISELDWMKLLNLMPITMPILCQLLTKVINQHVWDMKLTELWILSNDLFWIRLIDVVDLYGWMPISSQKCLDLNSKYYLPGAHYFVMLVSLFHYLIIWLPVLQRNRICVPVTQYGLICNVIKLLWQCYSAINWYSLFLTMC